MEEFGIRRAITSRIGSKNTLFQNFFEINQFFSKYLLTNAKNGVIIYTVPNIAASPSGKATDSDSVIS